jgi:glutaminyl-peptide cyclotransferase
MDLKRTGEFPYEGEGWGLAFDGENFVTSNGTGRLFFRDKETFKVVRHIDVTKSGRLVGQLNELEITGGKIYANRLYTDWIYVIDPNSGKVVSEIDLEGLWPLNERPRDGVLNGIAVNPKTEKMIVTGKYCPYMYELELKPVERN